MKLENISFKQAQEYFSRKDIVAIPVGSIENHGAHLALGTDYLISRELAEMTESRLDILFAPAMPYGNADGHLEFPGTVSIGEEGLYVVMKAITDSLYNHGARKFVFLNGHGGNINPLSRVGLELNRKGGLSAILNAWMILPALNPNWIGGHAAGQETSCVLAIDEKLVYLNELCELNLNHLTPDMTCNNLNGVFYKNVNIPVPRATINISGCGWAGSDHPKTASVEEGRQMLNALADYYVDFIREFEKI